MKTTPSARRVLLLALPLLLLACAPAAPPPLEFTAESAKLVLRDIEWADLATAGKDVEKILTYWTDDAVVMQSGQPPAEGKAAIRAFVTASFGTPGFKIHWVSQQPTFSPDGKMAYMRGTTEMTVPGPKGAPMALHLQGYSIWRIDADGLWRCVVDLAADAPPPPAKG